MIKTNMGAIMRKCRTQLGIIGLGNVLMGDDALGPHSVALLASRWEWPDSVALLDLGTPGPELAQLLLPFEKVVVVDSVNTGAQPGSVARIGHSELTAAPEPGTRTPHDPGLVMAMRQLELTGDGPAEITLLGVVPENLDTGAGLSPTVRAALPALLEAVVAEAASHAIIPKKRAFPLPENLWWEPLPADTE